MSVICKILDIKRVVLQIPNVVGVSLSVIDQQIHWQKKQGIGIAQVPD